MLSCAGVGEERKMGVRREVDLGCMELLHRGLWVRLRRVVLSRRLYSVGEERVGLSHHARDLHKSVNAGRA